MAYSLSRAEIRRRLDMVLRKGTILILGGAGNGLSAKCEEIGGVDLLLFDASSRCRMDGRPAIASYFGYRNANDTVGQMSKEMLGVIKHTPVLAGVSAADPFCNVSKLIDTYIDLGFSGIANSPSVGWFEESELVNLEKTEMGYDAEIEMIRRAHESDIFTVAFCWRESQAAAMAQAGADAIILHLGFSVGGLTGVGFAPDFEESVAMTQAMINAIPITDSNPYLFCHGGMLTNRDIVEEFFSRVIGLHGFYGGSAIDRIPMERAISDTGKRFKNLTLALGKK